MSGILFSFTAVQWPVRVHWTSGIALMLAATSGGVPLTNPAAVLIWAGVILCVVLTSDLVSARLAHLAGARTEAIVLSGVGGELIFARGAGLGPLVHLGGPAVALLVATFAELVAQVLRHQLPAGGIWMLERWAAASLFWGLFSLLPIRPLDGGEALHGALSRAWGEEKAEALSLRVSVAAAVLVALAGLDADWRFVPFIAAMCLLRNLRLT